MKNFSISTISAVVYVAVFVWVVTLAIYPLYPNPNDIMVILYATTFLLSLMSAFVDEKKMLYWSLAMMALTPSVEILWSIYKGLSFSQIFGDDRDQLGLNMVDTQGFILLSIIGPGVILYLGKMIHKSNVKAEKEII